MTTKDSARAILDSVGGAANVAQLQHCSTRLRFNLVDDAKADEATLKATPGVIGVVRGPQTQVIVGSGVADYFREIEKLRGGTTRAAAKTSGDAPRLTWKRAGSVAMDFIVGVFTPIIPAIAGAGILKSLLVALAALGWLPNTDPSYLVLAAIADAVFFFLPLLVAFTAARKLNVNIPLALGITSLLVFPTFTGLLAQEGGIALFGLTVPNVAYNAQVFPSILTVLLLWGVERGVTRITPGPIRVFFVPLVCFVIVSPLMIFVLGPLGFGLGSLLTGAMLWLYGTLGWIAVALLAGVLPFIISVGMHKAFIPPTIATVGATGRDAFYLVSSLAHNIAESGSSFAVAFRTKNKTLRGTAISAGVSALFGITEPALYGVTLQNRRALLSVVVGSVVSGAYLGITVVQAFAVVGPGLASITMYVDALNPWNFINAVIGFVIAFAVSFVITMVIWKDSDSATVRILNEQAGTDELADPADPASAASPAAGTVLLAPMTGEVIALEKVDDPVFSGGVLGPGVAVRPTDGEVRAPISGVVASLLPSKHAIGIAGDDGVEVLVHVGLDTVQLEGAPFTTLVAQGDRVEAGQVVIRADLTAILERGYDITTPIVVLNGDDLDVAVLATGDKITAGDDLLSARTKEVAGGAA